MTMRRTVLRAALLTLVLAAGFVAGQLSAAQPRMQSALKDLRSARSELNAATADKGGHRGRALALVNDAIAEVERGIAYDRRR
jgi:hypothetical protein